MREGRLTVDAAAGHEIHYRIFGDAETTLVGLHGGPGARIDYLDRLAELADDTLQVVLYDQLGSGQSDRPDDPSLWVVPRFVAELETVRHELDLKRPVLYGQSWGGMLAMEYELAHPGKASALVLSNTGASVPEIFRGMTRLRAALPADDFGRLVRYEAQGDYENPEYVGAVNRLYARHLRRATPWTLEQSVLELEKDILPTMADLGPAYRAMWGPNEFLLTGTLSDWDITDRLTELTLPCMIVCGLHDEIPIDVHQTLADRLPDNEFLIFGNSSHCTILEKEADAYLAAIRSFVARKASGTL